MKKLLATTAVALVAMAGAASAQSVLERVLSEIDNSTNLASVNGTFANIAENIGVAVDTEVTVYSAVGTGVTYTEDEYAAELASYVDDQWSGLVDADLDAEDNIVYTVGLATYTDADLAEAAARSLAQETFASLFTVDTITVAGGAVSGIDGSITNVVDGISDATQIAIANAGVSATEWNMPTMAFGDMSTTVLGAVNTGDITLGVNQAVDEAKTSTTGAYSAVVDQLGGSADTGAIVLNIASNMTGVNGSISTTMADVNGTVGAAATTVLGAVNTGTIVSGVNAAVSGIVSTGTEQLAN